MKIVKCLTAISEKLIPLLEWFSPLSILGLRLWVANVFYSSGILKLPQGFLGIGQGNWDTTLILFTHEHPVPFLAPEVAAVMGTAMEILAPVALVLGLGARLGAVGLLTMTAVIEFTYQHSPEHIVWALFLSVILLQGPGKISLDHFIRKKYLG